VVSDGSRLKEEELYLRLETREHVQTNEAKSKRRRASPTQTTSRRDNTPASRCLPSMTLTSHQRCWLVKVTGGPPPPQGSRGGGRIPKR